MAEKEFLPVSKQEMQARGWDGYDFLVVTADAYVDHPSFGTSIIARVLEADGYRVAVLAQPDWRSVSAFQRMTKPRYGVFIGGGNIDSMVAHYSAARHRRSRDQYSPGGKMGLRPDRPTIVYANRVREAFPGTPIVIGGLEASLRRFAHYDYWDDGVRRAILFDTPADLLIYGMGETAAREIAARLAAGTAPGEITDVRGTAYIASSPAPCPYPKTTCASFEEVCASKRAYAEATRVQYDEHDPVRGKAILQRSGDQWLIVNPPSVPLCTEELDRVAELPYMREVHPMYDADGGVSAIDEVRFSVTHNRGCFGGCNFCALAFHQGRMITARSHASCIREVEGFVKDPKFKGYVHDVGGPSANFRHLSCQKQVKQGLCKERNCLAPDPCPNIDADHSDYLALLRELRAIPGVKKVFVRSGIRYDYLLAGANSDFFRELVQYHISGQLKVAPEHCVAHVLDDMGKPHFDVFEKFWKEYQKINAKEGKDQYLVPYLMSSHPGCTLADAVELAEFLHSTGHQPEQVQDFYPTPGTLSTCMYYTGIDPRTMKPIYVATDPHDKALQRALLQWRRPEMRRLVIEALNKAGREDLIGYGKNCLARPLHGKPPAWGEKVRKDGRPMTDKPGKKAASGGKEESTVEHFRPGEAKPHRGKPHQYQGGKPSGAGAKPSGAGAKPSGAGAKP
ncbi:MAG: YgiQ family radical SAM protein, partial [Oscillospiraceae bacterium]